MEKDNSYQSISATFEVPQSVCNALVIMEQLGSNIEIMVEEDGLVTLSAVLHDPCKDGDCYECENDSCPMCGLRL